MYSRLHTKIPKNFVCRMFIYSRTQIYIHQHKPMYQCMDSENCWARIFYTYLFFIYLLAFQYTYTYYTFYTLYYYYIYIIIHRGDREGFRTTGDLNNLCMGFK